jgi:DNA-binding IscR family transcriptional regulator
MLSKKQNTELKALTYLARQENKIPVQVTIAKNISLKF